MSEEWTMKDPATKVAAMLWSSGQQMIPAEVLKLSANTAAIVVDVDGVDYVLTMQRVPLQRPRPIAQ